METTMLAILVPIAYVAGWLVAGRVIYIMMDDDLDDPIEGVMAMMAAIIWPVLAIFTPAWMFVTWPRLKKERAAHRAKLEREKEWANRAKTADLERSIYGRSLP